LRAWLSTVFSGLDYRITVSSVTYGASVLSDIHYSISADSFGRKGIVSGCFTFRLYSPLGIVFQKGDMVELSTTVTGSAGIAGQIFYIDDYSKSGNVYSLTCYDGAKYLDAEFDASDYPEKKEDPQTHKMVDAWYETATVLGYAATQCGRIGGIYYSPVREPLLCRNDLYGKTCRQILEDISVVDCGCWRMVSGTLSFTQFLGYPSASIDWTQYPDHESYHTEIDIQGSQRISGAYASGAWDGSESAVGGVDTERVDISGRYVSADKFTAVASQVIGSGWYLYGWSCASWADSDVHLVDLKLFNVIAWNGCLLPVLSISRDFGAIVRSSYSAPRPEAMTYMTKRERENRRTVNYDTVAGGSVRVTREGGLEAVPNVPAPVQGGTA
jgi:hypothetical protein